MVFSPKGESIVTSEKESTVGSLAFGRQLYLLVGISRPILLN